MLKSITIPEELITVNDASLFMRAEFSTEEEALIESFITASRQWCENYLRRAIGLQTFKLTLERFPNLNYPILLRPPLKLVSSIKYFDVDNVEQTLDPNDYFFSFSEPGQVKMKIGIWPKTFDRSDAVVVTFSSGYQDGSPIETEALPKTIRTAILMQVADLYENREAQTDRELKSNPTLERLLSTLRLEMGQ